MIQTVSLVRRLQPPGPEDPWAKSSRRRSPLRARQRLAARAVGRGQEERP
jgi:hypothetical protein